MSTSEVFRLDNDTAIIPRNIVKVELVDQPVNLYSMRFRGHCWVVRVTTTGGGSFVLGTEQWVEDSEGTREDAEKLSRWAKDKLITLYEQVLYEIDKVYT